MPPTPLPPARAAPPMPPTLQRAAAAAAAPMPHGALAAAAAPTAAIVTRGLCRRGASAWDPCLGGSRRRRLLRLPPRLLPPAWRVRP